MNLTVLGGALQAAKQQFDMKDYYTIYLRGYCGWNGDDTYANCSSPKAIFWFDPITVWGLDSNTTGSSIEELLPSDLKTGLDTYEKVSKAMSVVYIVALAATVLTLLVGISAIFSRWGSLATTFFAAASGIFLLAGSIIAIALFATLKTVLNHELEDDYGIHTSIGHEGYVTTWVGTAFAVGAAFFWLLSVCCCSGRYVCQRTHDYQLLTISTEVRTTQPAKMHAEHEPKRHHTPMRGSAVRTSGLREGKQCPSPT